MSWQICEESPKTPSLFYDGVHHTPTPRIGDSLRLGSKDLRVVRVVRSIMDEKNWNKHEAPASSSYLDLVYVEIEV
jgi:hypothetical protein